MRTGKESARRRDLGAALLLMCAGFTATVLLLHLLVLHPLRLYGVERSEKLEMLRRARYDYASAAFGSSHVHLGLDPRVFDARLAGTPLLTHSVNLGLNGGSQVEQRSMALDFMQHLQAPHVGPCLILLEVTAPADFSLQLASNPRSINIYDSEAERLSASFHLPGDTTFLKLHIKLTSYLTTFEHAINLGMLSNRVFTPPLLLDRVAEESVNDRRGFDFEPLNDWGTSQVFRVFEGRPLAPQYVNATLEPGNLRLVQQVNDAVPSGVHPQFIWLVMPLLRDLTTTRLYPPSQHAGFGDVPVVNLARPDLYPELYRRELWADDQHLTESGARLLTGYLAEAIMRLNKEQRLRQNCGG